MVFTVEVLIGILAEDVPVPLLPFRETFVFVPSTVDPLFELELFPVPLEDSTIFKGGTFNPLPADTASGAFPIPDGLPEALDELSLSSFSLSEWSRLCGFFGLFVAEAEPDDDDGLFLSLLSEAEEPVMLPLPFPVDDFPNIDKMAI